MEITGDNKRSETDRGRGYARGGRAVGQQQWTDKENTSLTSRPSFWKSRPRQHIEKHRCHFANKGPDSQKYVFSSCHVHIWQLDPKEGWVPKNWCFQIVLLVKTLESPLDWKQIKPVNPNGNQSWIFIGRTDTEAEVPILWPLATWCEDLTH